MTRARQLAWIGRDGRHEIQVPYQTRFLTEADIGPQHEAFTMPGHLSVVVIWDRATRDWVGFTTAALYRTVAARPIHTGTPDDLNPPDSKI